MFSFVLVALAFLVIGGGAFLARLENIPASLFQDKPKISVRRYVKYAVVFLLLFFLPVPIPLGLKILLWALFLVRLFLRLAEDFMPAQAGRILAILDPIRFERIGKDYFDDRRIRREFDAVARLVRDGNKQAALKLCDKLADQGDMSPGTVTMVRGYLEESPATPLCETTVSVNPPAEVAATVSPEPTVDQLIAEHRYGTAAEGLQRQINARPGDYELFMRYLNLLAVHCANPHAAVRALRNARHRHEFSPEQMAAAGEHLLQIHPDLGLGDDGIIPIKNPKKPKVRKNSEVL